MSNLFFFKIGKDVCVCKYIFICNEKKNELICPASLGEEIG